jgi:hypothetical protein
MSQLCSVEPDAPPPQPVDASPEADPLRIALVVVMSSLFVLAFVLPVGRRIFELPLTEPWAYGLGAAFIVAAYPLLILGARVSDKVGPWHTSMTSR